MSSTVDEVRELPDRLDVLFDEFASRSDWEESFLRDVYERDWVVGLSVLKTPKTGDVAVPLSSHDPSFPDSDAFSVPLGPRRWTRPAHRATAVVLTTRDGTFILETGVEGGLPAVVIEVWEWGDDYPAPDWVLERRRRQPGPSITAPSPSESEEWDALHGKVCSRIWPNTMSTRPVEHGTYSRVGQLPPDMDNRYW